MPQLFSRVFLVVATACFLLGGFGAAPAGSGQVGSPFIDLGTLPGRTNSNALALNDDRQVIGNSWRESGHLSAFLWQDGKMVALGTLGGSYSTARAINSRGDVVGSSTTKSGALHAFLWEKGRMRDLGTLGGTRSEAVAVNDRGQVVGLSTTKNGAAHAFLWQKGRMRDLGTLGGAVSEAIDVNAAGQIVGSSTLGAGAPTSDRPHDRDPNPARHPFLWQDRKITDLGTFSGFPESKAVAVNERGDVIGTASWDSGGNRFASRAFLWHDGKLTTLPTLGGDWSDAVGIDNRANVAGNSQDGHGRFHAVLWRNGHTTDLGSGQAMAMSASGEIVGVSGTDPHHAFAWHEGVIRALPAVPGGESAAYAVNDRGDIAGVIGQEPEHAVLWTRS